MSFSARLAGSAVEVEVGPDALRAGDVEFGYPDMDAVVVDGWTVTLRGPGREVTLSELGRGRDEFLRALRAARLPARRAAMLQSGSAAPIDSFDAWRGEEPVVVGVHADGITVESDAGVPDYIPLSCLESVERTGYRLTLRARGLDPVEVGRLGARTDEFLGDLEIVRRDLAKRTAEAYEALDPALGGFTAPDGWAVTRAEAGPSWEPLRAAFAAQERAREIDVLASIAGEGLRLGLKASFGGRTMPFALAPAGERVAVESADAEARATFVFATADVARLNAVLLQTSFRREALSLPEHELGRWAVAVRMLPQVRWARDALAARVVHDPSWEAGVRAALA